MANRSQVSRREINNSIHNNKPKDEPMHVAYCLDCDQVLLANKDLDFVKYEMDKHLRFPQTVEHRILLGKLFDLQGELTVRRFKDMAQNI